MRSEGEGPGVGSMGALQNGWREVASDHRGLTKEATWPCRPWEAEWSPIRETMRSKGRAGGFELGEGLWCIFIAVYCVG